MKTCTQCDNPLEREDAAFCTNCGAKVLDAGGEASDESPWDAGIAPTAEAAVPEETAPEPPPAKPDPAEVVSDSPPAPSIDSAEGGAGPDPSLPITLECDLSTLLIQASYGLLKYRLKSLAGHAIEQISLAVTSESLGGKSLSSSIKGLQGGHHDGTVVNLSVLPEATGSHALTIAISYRAQGLLYVVSTDVASQCVTVLTPKSDASSVQVNISNQISASDYGINSVRLEQHLGEVERIVEQSRDLSTNQLLMKLSQLPPLWGTLRLGMDEEATRKARQQDSELVTPIRLHPMPPHIPADRLSLTQAGGGRETAIAAQVLSRLPIRMSRTSTDDLVLRVLPRSAENDEHSKMISGSKPHLILRMENGVPELDDPGSANGVWVDNHRLDDPRPLNARGPSRIDFAHVLSLQLTPIPSSEAAGRYARLGGQDALWRWAAEQGISGYKIAFIEGQGVEAARPPVYLPMRWVDLVIDARLGLIVNDQPGRAPAVRIVRTSDGLWIEACISGVSIDGKPLMRAKAVPLELNTTLAINGNETQLGAFVQHLG